MVTSINVHLLVSISQKLWAVIATINMLRRH